jgi:hypothetical protein
VNPKIIQRKARLRKIETALRYDHVSDDMVREYFNKIQQQNNISTGYKNDNIIERIPSATDIEPSISDSQNENLMIGSELFL